MNHQTFDLSSGRDIRSDAMEVFFAWEKLRLLYNVVMAVNVVIFAVSFGKAQSLSFWVDAGLSGAIANLCFCAGPVAENYLHWAGWERRMTRILLFLLGACFTAAFAFEFVIGFRPFELFPDK